MNNIYLRCAYPNELYHHGIKGQKWGIRRYQNADGSLTEAGKKRYAKEIYKQTMRYTKLPTSAQRGKRHEKALTLIKSRINQDDMADAKRIATKRDSLQEQRNKIIDKGIDKYNSLTDEQRMELGRKIAKRENRPAYEINLRARILVDSGHESLAKEWLNTSEGKKISAEAKLINQKIQKADNQYMKKCEDIAKDILASYGDSNIPTRTSIINGKFSYMDQPLKKIVAEDIDTIIIRETYR